MCCRAWASIRPRAWRSSGCACGSSTSPTTRCARRGMGRASGRGRRRVTVHHEVARLSLGHESSCRQQGLHQGPQLGSTGIAERAQVADAPHADAGRRHALQPGRREREGSQQLGGAKLRLSSAKRSAWIGSRAVAMPRRTSSGSASQANPGWRRQRACCRSAGPGRSPTMLIFAPGNPPSSRLSSGTRGTAAARGSATAPPGHASSPLRRRRLRPARPRRP